MFPATGRYCERLDAEWESDPSSTTALAGGTNPIAVTGVLDAETGADYHLQIAARQASPCHD
jgi:hypothetical protein